MVTGGSGFIGTNLVTAYRRAGVAVTNADIAPPRNPDDRDVWVRVDVMQLEDLHRLFSEVQPTHIFHLAARTDLDGRRVSDYGANVAGVRHLLHAIQNSESVVRTVVASSRLVCRIGYEPSGPDDYCPTTAYGASKIETERLVRGALGLPAAIVRPTSIWGPWFDRPYRDFFMSIARGHYVHPAGCRIAKSFGYVGNSIWQLHRVMNAPAADVLDRTFYMADDPPLEVGAFADCIAIEMDRRPTRAVPLSVFRTFARVGDAIERTGRRAPLTSFRLENLLTPMVHNVAPVMRLSAPLPYNQHTGVTETVAWMRRQGLIDASR